eukprot:6458231-Amphidinium_carterae.2
MNRLAVASGSPGGDDPGRNPSNLMSSFDTFAKELRKNAIREVHMEEMITTTTAVHNAVLWEHLVAVVEVEIFSRRQWRSRE